MKKNKEERIQIPFRMSKELFASIRKIEKIKKDDERGYSINKFILEAIEVKIKEEDK